MTLLATALRQGQETQADESTTTNYTVDPGYFDYQARTAFRDLVRLYGFEEARRTMAEIINTEADGRTRHHG